MSGGSACPIYDGEAMAKKRIVFVSINYRVGVFGFFTHPELTKESGNNASGNYGTMDQIAALKWIQKNIAAFGGDPNNVTIAGQSAGSMSVNCLVASPLAKHLFQKAIAESGASFSNGNANLQKAEEDGTSIMKSAGASSIADLRAMPAEELMKKVQGFRGPVIDGYVLPDAIVNIFNQGKENKVSLLTGWNEDEGLMFGPPKNAEDFKKDAEKNYGADAQTFLQRAITLGPNLVEAYYELGRARWFGGNTAGARDAWRDGAHANKFNPWGKRCSGMLQHVDAGGSPPRSS